MNRFKLTKTAKVLLVFIIVVLIGGGIALGVKTGVIKTDNGTEDISVTDNDNAVKSDSDTGVNTVDNNTASKNNTETAKNTNSSTNTINLSIDEWVGYATILQANGGLTTQPGSIYDKLGINVNINIINDATQSSNALIKGDIDGAGYTVNRLAFLSNKFTSSGTKIIMPYITNYSNGGDGIIALSSIKTIDDLVNAKIGVPQFSESQAMIVWFVNQSDLPQSDKDKIINNLILFETADETAKAFFAGQIDVAGTWQPYLTQAENMTDSHILFSTANSTKLIMSGVIFRDDFAKSNPELVSKFIDGTLQAIDSYDKDLEVLRNSMPMFNGMSDEDIIGMTADAALATWKNNMEILNGDAKTIYDNMCDVWTSIGEKSDKTITDTLFDTSYMEALKDKYETSIINNESSNTNKVSVTKQNEQEILNTTALLTKSSSVRFIANTAKFLNTTEASAELDDFVSVAKMLDGAIIQIEGNIASDNDSEDGVVLSKQRAETVKQYFVMNGIDADRIVVVGNGGTKPVAPNDTEENMQKNRRTDVSFKIIE